LKAFSIEAALKTGFGLLRREWRAALAWGAIYIAVIMAVQLLMVGPAFLSTLAGSEPDPEAMSQAMSESLKSGAWPLVILGYLLIMVTAFVLYGAIARAQLRPEERGRLYIRFSRQELWMGLSTLVLWLILVPVMIVVAFGVMSVVGSLGGDGDVGLLVWVLSGIPLGVGCLYVLMRLSLTWLIAWDEARFVLFDSWRMTRGHGWRLVLLYLALMFLVLIMSIGVLLALLAVGLVLGLAAKLLGPLSIILSVVGALTAIVAYVGMMALFLVIAISPWIEAYRGIRAAQTAEPEPEAA
jgi:hypothetical protein